MSSHKLFKKSFNPGKCKTSMKLAMSRMKLLSIKRHEQLKVVKRNLAQILQSGQEQTARARVEHVYREENTIAAYDLLESFCEQIIARLQIIESQKKCPLDLEEPISTILFASQRCVEIQEFTDIRRHFTSKYGKEFVSAAVELRAGSRVNRMVIEKLSAKTPDGQTKLKMLAAIAKEHNVDWDPHVVEEQVLDLLETKIAGPTEFTSAATEFPDVPKHNPGTRVVDHDTNMRPPERPKNAPSADTSRANFSSQINSKKPSDPDPGTSNANVAPDYQSRGSENVAAGPAVDIKYKRDHWRMDFKDATEAAKAAAESAVRASIAARAAAQLSTLDKMSRQNSTESSETERSNVPAGLPHPQLNRTFQEGLENKNESPPTIFHATDTTFQRQVKDNGEEKPEIGYDHTNLKETSSKSGSSHSSFSSHNDELLATASQWTERLCPSSTQQKETAIKWQNHENVRDDFSEDGNYDDSKMEIVTESFGGPLVANLQRTEHSPPENVSLNMKWLASESDNNGSHGEGSISESTFTVSKRKVDTELFSSADHHFSVSSTSGEEIFSRGDTAEPVSAYDSGAIFDHSDSESEGSLDLEDAVVQSKLDSLVPDAGRSSKTVPSTLDPWKSREPGKESLKKDGYTMPSSSTADAQYRSSSSNRNVKTTVPSPFYDPVHLTHGNSDDLDAISDEEANGSSPPIIHNVSSTRDSPSSAHIKHGPVESASYSRNEVREHKKKQAPGLHDSDSDDSFDGNTVSASAYAPGARSPVRSSVLTVKDQKRMNSLELHSVTTTISYTDTGGPEPSVDSDTGSPSILRFDRLGGLRNKGYVCPPYRRNPSRFSSGNANSLTSEESLLSNTPEVFHTSNVSLSLRENQVSSKWKESSELQKEKTKISGHYFDDTDSDSDEFVGPDVSIIQGVGRRTRTTGSSDFQEHCRISGSKTEVSASVESGVSMKSTLSTPILNDEKLSNSVNQDAISDSGGETALKTNQVLKPSKQEMFSELQRGNGRSSASYKYCDLDSRKFVDAGISTGNGERDNRRTMSHATSVRTASRSTHFSQPTTNSNSMYIDELDKTTLDSSFSDESRQHRSVRGTDVEEQPRRVSTQKMETRTPRTSYGDSDSDESIDTDSLLHQKLVTRSSKASTSYMTAARGSPRQATQLGGPEIIKVDSASHHSVPVSHVEGQPQHPSSTGASRSSKNFKPYGLEVANKGSKPSEPRTLIENKEMKSSRTDCHDFGSDSDESTEARAHVRLKMVNRNSKDDSSQRTALRENPPYQPTGAGSKLRAKVEVPDSKVFSTSLRSQPPETLTESQTQTKPADVKPSGSSVPTTSRESSFQRASHVHPKLPDYDSLIEMLQAAQREK